MKRLLYVLTFLVTVLSACKKDKINSVYDNSFEKWQAFKKQSNNSYSYTAYRAYAFFAERTETKITVKNGKVVQREFTMWSNQATGGGTPPSVVETWMENEDSLNTHDQLRAAETLTLDEIYAKAKKQWLNVSKKDNDVSFRTDNDGIISSAGYVSKGCQDDCFTGISIKDLKKL
ncbi:hypothetical protein ACFQZX_10490 [Mucilaginibacter litoreus]|uniref:Lipoprotein n=1 Tax=Mucilaginibacter litoreus TaxID=1048221 RepID=A0ABW3AU95_9SPHI